MIDLSTVLDDYSRSGSEDFADMLKVVPGAYCRVGHAGTTGLHNPSFFLDPEILPIGASIMARIAERRLISLGALSE
jgi:metal-dependent amidase/aminoacylase/carboxypeptidase family protein